MQFACLQIAWHNCCVSTEIGERICFRIKPQPRGLILCIGPVAVVAAIGQDWPDLEVVGYLVARNTTGIGARCCQHGACDDGMQSLSTGVEVTSEEDIHHDGTPDNSQLVHRLDRNYSEKFT